MELQHALSQIADIRQQMSRARQFHGFRSATTFMTALAAFAAGIWQANTSLEPTQFIALWVCVAIGCIGLCSTELFLRCCNSESESQSKLARQAVEQFLPFVIVGGLLTGIMWEYAPGTLWTLPALWQILFGLGLYSLRRIVPMPITIVGGFYILCGFVNLSASTHLSPWSMSLPFGVGQMLSALILYWYLERRHAA